MSEIFIQIIFAHIIGDFWLQPKWMATKKGSSDRICFLHCTIYTICVGFFTNFNIMWLFFVLANYIIVDRFSLADTWLKIINGRSLENFLYHGHKDIPHFDKNNYASIETNYRILRGSFSACVYLIVDASFHLIPMCIFYSWLFK